MPNDPFKLIIVKNSNELSYLIITQNGLTSDQTLPIPRNGIEIGAIRQKMKISQLFPLLSYNPAINSIALLKDRNHL